MLDQAVAGNFSFHFCIHVTSQLKIVNIQLFRILIGFNLI